MGIVYSTRVVRDGLVLQLDAANPKSYPGSGTVWTDLSGNSNDGTLTNGPTFDNGNGGNFVFDGINDYVSTELELPSPSTTSTTFDIVFRYNGSSAYRGLMGASSYRSSGFSIGFMGQTSIMVTYNASDLSYEPTWTYDSSVISQGTFVFDGRNITAYRNGSVISTHTASFDVVANYSGIQIARNLQGGWGVSQVDVYSVKVYNQPLSEAEIQQNFEAMRGRYGI
jgi:hypothetical protein